MLLWINGPFGGGKTQTAHEIQRRLPTHSVICDPEEVGFGLVERRRRTCATISRTTRLGAKKCSKCWTMSFLITSVS